MTRRHRLVVFALCTVLELALPAVNLTEQPEATSTQLQRKRPNAGLTKEDAIEVCEPRGERAYLNRLRCPDGSPVRYKQRASFGPRNEPKSPEEKKALLDQMVPVESLPAGQKDFHVVDGYEVRCKKRRVRLYLDMYHCPEPAHQAPPGYTLVLDQAE